MPSYFVLAAASQAVALLTTVLLSCCVYANRNIRSLRLLLFNGVCSLLLSTYLLIKSPCDPVAFRAFIVLLTAAELVAFLFYVRSSISSGRARVLQLLHQFSPMVFCGLLFCSGGFRESSVNIFVLQQLVLLISCFFFYVEIHTIRERIMFFDFPGSWIVAAIALCSVILTISVFARPVPDLSVSNTIITRFFQSCILYAAFIKSQQLSIAKIRS